MVKHIVMFSFKDEAEGQSAVENAQKARDMLLVLKDSVPSLRSMEVGLNEKPSAAASDLVLVSEFDDFEGLAAYVVHPEHEKVAQFIRSVVTNRHIVDFTV